MDLLLPMASQLTRVRSRGPGQSCPGVSIPWKLLSARGVERLRERVDPVERGGHAVDIVIRTHQRRDGTVPREPRGDDAVDLRQTFAADLHDAGSGLPDGLQRSDTACIGFGAEHPSQAMAGNVIQQQALAIDHHAGLRKQEMGLLEEMPSS